MRLHAEWAGQMGGRGRLEVSDAVGCHGRSRRGRAPGAVICWRVARNRRCRPVLRYDGRPDRAADEPSTPRHGRCGARRTARHDPTVAGPRRVGEFHRCSARNRGLHRVRADEGGGTPVRDVASLRTGRDRGRRLGGLPARYRHARLRGRGRDQTARDGGGCRDIAAVPASRVAHAVVDGVGSRVATTSRSIRFTRFLVGWADAPETWRAPCSAASSPTRAKRARGSKRRSCSR